MLYNDLALVNTYYILRFELYTTYCVYFYFGLWRFRSQNKIITLKFYVKDSEFFGQLCVLVLVVS